MTFSATISPACLPSDAAQSYAGQTATATGWGKLDYNDFTEAAYLQVILASDWLIRHNTGLSLADSQYWPLIG